MKLESRTRRRRRSEQGLVTVLVLILMLLAGIYVAVNNRVLAILKSELELLQQRHAISQPVEPEEGR